MEPSLHKKRIKETHREPHRKETQKACSKSADLPLATRNKLIQVAKTLFSEKGFDGSTVKEIADAADVNISLISYHFDGKEGLYRACLEQLGMARLAVAQNVLQDASSLEEFKLRLQLFIEELLRAHLEEPEVCRIITRECDLQFPIARDIFQNTFLKVYETLVHFFKSAQKKDLLRKDLEIETVAHFLFGGLIHSTQKDEINEAFFGRTIKDPLYRANLIQNSVSFCLFGCANQNPSLNGALSKPLYENKTL